MLHFQAGVQHCSKIVEAAYVWAQLALDVCAAGVVVGLLALGESLPTTQRGRSLRLAAWLCIAAGVALLANGQGEQPAHLLCPQHMHCCGCKSFQLK